MDYETRSRVELKKYGVYPYVECPDFAPLMAAWALNNRPVELAVGTLEIRLDLEDMLRDPSVIKVAHNAQFERIVTSAMIGLPVGTYLDPDPWFDTAAIACEQGWPRKLAPLAQALGGGELKDEAGTRLINLFCKPNRKGEWNGPDTHPVEWQQFCDYCVQDVATLRDVFKRMKGLAGWPTLMERRVFMADQYMNDRGVEIDLWMAQEAVRCREENSLDQMNEITSLSHGMIVNPNSQPQMMAWVREEGIDCSDMQAGTIEALLVSGTLTEDQHRILELKSELALTASHKFSAAVGGISSDGRLRGQFKFYGAHTGRWSGRGVQLQNLPRAGLPNKTAVDEAILTLKLGERVEPHTLKCLVRPLLVGPFTRFDYSSIEARVIAWLAGEKWALDAFAAERDIYVETAKKMGGLTRAQGKVAVLALGFAGGVGSLTNMLGISKYMESKAEKPDPAGLPDFLEGKTPKQCREELVLLVRQWRKANPKIVQFWSAFDEAIAEGGRVGKHIMVKHTRNHRGVTMHVTLPSGRSLNYHGLKWMRTRMEDPKTGKFRMVEGWTYIDPQSKNRRIGTYGGRMTENVVQATARDIMAEAMVALEYHGLPVVGTVHDELIIEGAHDLGKVEHIMCAPPSWCPDMPIAAEGGHLDRYEK